ncbi:uncharacterized protein [Clytia hemisphaerica]|uniref:Uncharacterized protein n=1 Tax=Clytia hemisphaerica TaxID=252671 RepID=A0A7M5UDG4_9CNID
MVNVSSCPQCSLSMVSNNGVHWSCVNKICQHYHSDVLKQINLDGVSMQLADSIQQQNGPLTHQLATTNQGIPNPNQNHYNNQQFEHYPTQLNSAPQNGFMNQHAQNIGTQQLHNHNQHPMSFTSTNQAQNMYFNQQPLTNINFEQPCQNVAIPKSVQQLQNQDSLPDSGCSSWQSPQTNILCQQITTFQDVHSPPDDVFAELLNIASGVTPHLTDISSSGIQTTNFLSQTATSPKEVHRFCTECSAELAGENPKFCQRCGTEVPRKSIASISSEQNCSSSPVNVTTRKRTFAESESSSFKSSFEQQNIQSSSFNACNEWTGDVSMPPDATPPNSANGSFTGTTYLGFLGFPDNAFSENSSPTNPQCQINDHREGKNLRQLLQEPHCSQQQSTAMQQSVLPQIAEIQDLNFTLDNEEMNNNKIDTGLTINVNTLEVASSSQPKNPFTPDYEVDDSGYTQFHRLVKEEKLQEALDVLSKIPLLQKYKYVNHRNRRGYVALHTALQDFNKEFIMALLRHGADVYITDRNGNNIIHQIIKNPDFDESHVLALIQIIFKELDELRIQALINDESTSFNADGYSIIHEVVRKNYLEVLKYLRQSAKLNLNAIDRKEKQTGLVMACKARDWETAYLLIEMEACVNIPTSSEWYPVHAALEDHNEEMLDVFMNNGVDIYGYKECGNGSIMKKCEKYMRSRRRRNPGGDRGSKKRRRCKCGDTKSSVIE